MVDYRDKKLEFAPNSKCFIIWQHNISDENFLESNIREIIKAGCNYFSIFGEYYKRVIKIIERLDSQNTCVVFSSDTDLGIIAKEIIHYQKEDKCYLIYDDYMFADYTKEDFLHYGRDVLVEILFRVAARCGVVEFVDNGRDCIISINGDDSMIGYLGSEEHFSIPEFAFNAHLFDSKTFLEIWDDVKDQFV